MMNIESILFNVLITPSILIMIGFILVLVIISLYYISSTSIRSIILSLGVVSLPSVFLILFFTLGNGRPVSSDVFKIQDQKYEVISYYYIEDKNIFLWVLPFNEESKDPVNPLYLTLPWSKPQAAEIKQHYDEAKKAAGQLIIDFVGNENASSLYNPGEYIEYNVKLPEAPASKSIGD